MRWLPLMLAAWLAGPGHDATAQDRQGQISLALEGYNYTNRYIDSFSVDGQGGGNIYVSSPTSGGGGTSCCIAFYSGAKMASVKVRWQSHACYFSKQYAISGKMHDKLYLFYQEQEVPVEVQATTNAKQLEIHFYPDGTIQAAVTATASAPRLLLEKQREDVSRYPRCPNDREPR